jgi:hypothetical protein
LKVLLLFSVIIPRSLLCFSSGLETGTVLFDKVATSLIKLMFPT